MNRPHAFIAALALLSIAAIPACNIVAPVAYLATGGPKVPAACNIPSDRATVVFFDDLDNDLPRKALIETAGRASETALIANNVFLDNNYLISSRSASRAVANDTTARLTPIVDVGRALGAEVVIHVDIQEFEVLADGATVQPTASARIKVLDAVNNERLWPSSETGYSLEVETLTLSTPALLSRDDLSRIEEALANELGTTVARLFYEHERERLEDRRDRLGFGF